MTRRSARAGEELQDIRDAVCLDAYNDLISVKALALIIGVSRQTIWRWIKRARDNPAPPDLEIWCNGVGKTCIHGRPIVPGMPVVCVDCIEAGNVEGCTGTPENPAFRRVKYREPIKVAGESEQPKGVPTKPKWTREELRAYLETLNSKRTKRSKTTAAGGSGASS